MFERERWYIFNSIILGFVLLAFIVFSILLMTYPEYYDRKEAISNKEFVVKEIIDDNSEGIKEVSKEVNKYASGKDKSEKLYDKVITGRATTSFLGWLRIRTVKPEIDRIEENTEILKIDNVNVTSEITDGVEIYLVGDLKFADNRDSSIMTNVNTSIKIVYAEDQKKDDIIKDYTVVYQKEKP